MTVKTALILCAGYGKRLKPLTNNTPKPLLKIKNKIILESCIDLIINLRIKKILINTFYLKEQIYDFVKSSNYNLEIKIIDDGNKILETGGGILNMINHSLDENFLVFNPDTLWNNNYNDEIKKMVDLYFKIKSKNMLLLVKKDLSFDRSFSGDFDLKNLIVSNNKKKNFIYTGCQLLNKSILIDEKLSNFPISKIWNKLIKKNYLNGFESKQKFYHLTNLEIFKKLEDL